MVSGEALANGNHILYMPNARGRTESILGILGILSRPPLTWNMSLIFR
jgi:hypothetical protein